MTDEIKKASDYVNSPDGGIAVIIARHPCVIAYPDEAVPEKIRVEVTDACIECNVCLERFECPALYHDPELGRVNVNRELCVDCGVCIQVCPKGAIVEA
jgi:indolepyruvate ferredoxin oxidoreductase alpha subunit